MKQILAISTLAYLGYSFETVCEQISKIGCMYVEPCHIATYDSNITDSFFSEEQAQRYIRIMERFNLRCVALAAHMDLGSKNAVESFSKRMEFAHAIGCSYIHSNPTTIQYEKQFFDNIKQLSALAEKLGIIITLENPGDKSDSIMPDGETGVKIIAKINLPYVKMNYDPLNLYSFSLGKRKPEEDFLHSFGNFSHMHLKDMVLTNGGWEYTAIGQGVIDYKHILKKLLELPEFPPLSIELPLQFYRNENNVMTPLPPDKRPSLDDIKITLKKSIDFVEKIVLSN